MVLKVFVPGGALVSRLTRVMTVVLLAMLGLVPNMVSAGADVDVVVGDFEATIHQGPNAGLSMVGKLTLEVDEGGDLLGVLQVNGGKIDVTGRVTGGAIEILLHLGDGSAVFGIGSLPDGLSAGAVITGVAIGPSRGDKGDWELCIPISYQPPAVSSGNYDMLEESLTFQSP